MIGPCIRASSADQPAPSIRVLGAGSELVLDRTRDRYLASPSVDLRLVLLVSAGGTTRAHWFVNGKTVRVLLPVLREAESETTPIDGRDP